MGYGTTNTKSTKRDFKNSGRAKPVYCDARNDGKPCKWCVIVSKLYESKDEEDRDRAGAARAKQNYFMAVWHLKEKKLYAFQSNITIWRDLMQLLPDPDDDDDENVDFTNIKKPYPVVIKRVGSGRNTTYTTSISPKQSRFPKKYLKKPPINLDKILQLIEDGEVDILDLPPDKTTRILVFPPWSAKVDVPYKEIFFHWGTAGLVGTGEDDESYDDDDDWDDDDESTDDDDYEDDDDEDEDDDDYAFVPDFADMDRKALIAQIKKDKLKITKTKKADVKLGRLRRLVEKKWRDKFDVPI